MNTINDLVEQLANVFLGEKLPIDFYNSEDGTVIIPAGKKITKKDLKKLAELRLVAEINPSPMRRIFHEIVAKFPLELEN